MKTLEESLNIADIHADRMECASREIGFPISVQRLANFSLHELGILELYIGRFARLQDQLGRKVFPLLLKDLGDFDETMSFRDILSKLEKLEIIESSEEWSEVREIRNDISHEYPDDHEKMADALNKSYQKRYVLLDCLRSVNAVAAKLKEQQK